MVSLGAFGKHPAWDDHLEDLGLDTEALLTARQLLYVQGIGGLIESGEWNTTDPTDPTPEFAHLFYWFSQPDVLIGRLWASHDGKGRDRYPMVVCAHTAHLAPASVLDEIALALARLQTICCGTVSREQVRAAVDSAREQLRGTLLENHALPPMAPRTRREIADSIGLSAGSENAIRSWYALQSQLAAYTTARFTEEQTRLGPKIASFPILPQQARLPADPQQIGQCILFWRDFVSTLVGKHLPTLLIHPLGSSWVDLIVGSPTPRQLFCLKASPKAMPPVTEIPYNLPPEVKERASREFATFLNDKNA